MSSPSQILTILSSLYPNAGALAVGTPYHMVVMIALSARTRDEQILRLAPAFFARFPTVDVLASASIGDITSSINTIGLYKQKAKNLQAMARMIVDEFGGDVPRTMHDLVRLPGVGRKTASVMLSEAFGVPAIAVDTHVQRVTRRLGWVTTRTPETTERALRALLPPSMYRVVNRVFVPFGRTICIAGKPRCWECPLVNDCPFGQKQRIPPKNAVKIRESILRMHAGIRDLKDKLYAALR